MFFSSACFLTVSGMIANILLRHCLLLFHALLSLSFWYMALTCYSGISVNSSISLKPSELLLAILSGGICLIVLTPWMAFSYLPVRSRSSKNCGWIPAARRSSLHLYDTPCVSQFIFTINWSKVISELINLITLLRSLQSFISLANLVSPNFVISCWNCQLSSLRSSSKESFSSIHLTNSRWPTCSYASAEAWKSVCNTGLTTSWCS